MTKVEKVLGLGGVFFKARDPQALADWYRTHLGLDAKDFGGAFGAVIPFAEREPGYQVWTAFPASSGYFPTPFMVNFRVANLDAMLAQLRAAGVVVDDAIEASDDFGHFGWAVDPEGNRIELWQPPAQG